MVTGTVSRRSIKRSGFTLVELLLATVLLLLLLGAVVFSFSNLQRGAELDEGATQLEALIRFARAHASGTGRQVRIAFEEDVGDGFVVPLGNLHVQWEPDPLNAPGIFADLPEADSYVRSITDLVNVEFVRALEPDTEAMGTASLTAPDGSSTGATNESVWITFPPVTFFPDGSSDSTEITLASRNEEDGRRLIVKLIGMTGSIRRRVQAAEEPVTEPEATESKSEPMAEPIAEEPK